MSTTVKIIADSVSSSGKRITTFQLRYPRPLHSELMTHRQFSRNASSTRAINLQKQIEYVLEDPYIPTHWGMSQAGMSADKEFPECDIEYLKEEWLRARNEVVYHVKRMADTGLHQQVAGRLLEPWAHISVVVTATEWNNWYALRTDKNAHPDIQVLANKMLDAHNTNIPRLLGELEWHLPYVTEEEKTEHDFTNCLKFSVARCARVSYLNHDKTNPSPEKDIALYDRLLNNKHMSAFEHQAQPMIYNEQIYFLDYLAIQSGATHINKDGYLWSGNFSGWTQYRQVLKDNVYKDFKGLQK